MPTTLFLVRHAKAANRTAWTGADRDRPLVAKGQAQAKHLAGALAPLEPALVATSPWRRCLETAEPIAEAAGLDVAQDGRLGYDGPDLAGWVQAMLAAYPDRLVVAVSHGDLIPMFVLGAGLGRRELLELRTGSLIRLTADGRRLLEATLVDRKELDGLVR